MFDLLVLVLKNLRGFAPLTFEVKKAKELRKFTPFRVKRKFTPLGVINWNVAKLQPGEYSRGFSPVEAMPKVRDYLFLHALKVGALAPAEAMPKFSATSVFNTLSSRRKLCPNFYQLNKQ